MLLRQNHQLKLAKLQESHVNWNSAEHTRVVLLALKNLYDSRVNDAESHCDRSADAARLLLVEARTIKDIIAKLKTVKFIVDFGETKN